MRRAIFPGSFDPITLGHVDIINRALPLFDEIIIAIGINADKKYMFSLKERVNFIKENYKGEPKIKVLRNPADFEFEKAIAQTNRKLSGIETVFLLTSADTAFISSSIVRDVHRHGGDISKFVPKSVLKI